MPFIRTSTGVTLHYNVYGAGPPVLLNGGIGWEWVWRLNIPFLSSRYRLIAVDNRGVGDSEKPLGPYTVPMLARDMADVIVGLGLGPVNFVGLSLGSSIGQELALDYPGLVRSLTLIGASLGDFEQIPPAPHVAAGMMPNPFETPEQSIRRTLPLALAPGFPQRHPLEFEEMVHSYGVKPVPPHARAALLWAGSTWAGSGWRAPHVQAPVLVAQGMEDQVNPPPNAWAVATAFPFATLRYFPDAGHLCHMEQAALFNQELLQFLG